MAASRSYDKLQEEDDYLMARPTWAEGDAEAASRDLDGLIDSVGTRRDVV